MNIKISRKEIQAISDGYEVCGLLYTHEAKCIVCLRDSPKEFHVCKLPSQGLEDLCGKSAVIIVEEASASSTSRHSKTKLVCPDCRHEVREILEYVNEIQVFRCDYCDYSKPIADWLHQSIRTGTAGEASASSSITESTNFCGKNYCGTCPQAMHGIPNKDPGTHRCTGHKCNICKKEASASSTPVTLDKITCDFCEKTNLYDRIDDPLICKNCGEALEEFKRLMEKDNAMDERKQAKQTECQHPEEECYFCGHTCTLREEGDSASSPTSEHNFEWEAELDCLMAPPEQPQESSNSCYYDPRYYLIAPPEQPQEERQPSPSSEKEVTFLSYKSFDFKKRKPIEEVVTVVKMERKEFPEKTIFPPEFPAPVVCQEFCDKTARCHLRQNGIGDLCKSSNKFGKLVHRVDLKWSAWHDFRTRLPKTDMVHSSRTHGDVPEVALAHWGSPDAPMNDNGANGNDEYASPTQQAREFGDRDAVGFVPAFIFGPGKPEWRSIIVSPKNGIPYTKLVKYPSIRAIACKVELRNGYVVPVGKFGSVLKITTRADKKRMRAYTAIKKELTQYVGAERAAKMAGREVAAMATC